SAWGSDILIDPRRYPIIKPFTKYALKNADLVTCNSKTLKNGILELGIKQNKVIVIEHGVDTELFSPKQRNNDVKNRLGITNAPTVICSRSLKPVYNFEMFLNAMPLILRQIPETKFIIVGDGELMEPLQELACLLGVSSAVKFIGRVPHREIPEYLNSAEVYVSTSISDSTSSSLIEAMACGLSPVVTDLPANREWITAGENGFIVPQDDYQTLAIKVTNLLENAELRENMGKINRMMIMEKAEYGNEMNKMMGLYSDLVRNRSRGTNTI
ncbi:glycosyltransferase, partial [Chloroflexota bacterium]